MYAVEIRQSPLASMSSIVRRDTPHRSANARTDNPAAVRSSFSLIICDTSASGDSTENNGQCAEGDGKPQKPIKGGIYYCVGDICDSKKIDTKVLRNILEKSFCHVEIVPFLVYNSGKPIGEVSLPVGLA